MKKQVLCLIDTLSSGGAERQMSYLCCGLQKRGYDVTLMVFYPDQRFYEEEIVRSGVQVVYNERGRNPLRRIYEIISAVRRYKPEAVIAYKDGVTMAACIARALMQFRLIVSERNTTQELTRYERLKFFLYRFADLIVPNSFTQANFIAKYYPRLKSKTRVITNMLDVKKFMPDENKSICGDAREIITTARVMTQKNVLNYIRAISLLKKKGYNFKCNWYGYAEPEYTMQAKSLAKELQVDDIIEFHAPQKDVVAVYRSGDIFCLPSIYEGFPNALCEAMSCALPVACSSICDNPDIVEDNVNGFLFNPYKPSEIADKLSELLDASNEELAAIGARNRERIINMCAEDSFLDKYLSLINEKA